jgi:hypothetical protein
MAKKTVRTLTEARGEKVIEPKDEPIELTATSGHILSITQRPDGKKEILLLVEGDYELNAQYELRKK